MNKKKLCALLLAGAMVFTMGTSASTLKAATKESTPTTKAEIEKTVEVAEGITLPKLNFKFTVTPVTKDAPAASIADINYEGKPTGNLENGLYRETKTSKINFGAFSHAGVYEYDVKETANTYQATPNVDEVRYSTDTYRMRVYVDYEGEKLVVKNITAEKNTNNGTNTNKVGVMGFTNVYMKRGNSGPDPENPDPKPDPEKDPSLKITKEVSGDYADKTKEFTFQIVMTKAATEEAVAPKYIGYINGDENNPVEVIADGKTAVEFKLSDGDSLVFKDVPAGTRYVVTEKGVADDYTPSVQVTENGVQSALKKGNDADDLTSAEAGKTNLIGESVNIAAFTNTYKDVAITGIIMSNLPFIMLIVVAAAGLGALALIKKQRMARR